MRLTVRSPEDVIGETIELHGEPIARVCLFSGGNDSAAAAHRAAEFYDELVWLDTGTAVPGVEDFAHDFARWLGKPLRILRHDHDAYRLLVLGGMDPAGRDWHVLGFPGPAQHPRAYNRLKDRLLEQLTRELKVDQPRSARILCVTGIRAQESARRRGRLPVNRKAARVFANPLIDWSGADLRAYRAEHGVPQSDVAALLHRSGECNCGAFAAPGEREMLHDLWPAWFGERIESLEREATAIGLPCAAWGTRCTGAAAATEDTGDICQGCEQLEGFGDLEGEAT